MLQSNRLGPTGYGGQEAGGSGGSHGGYKKRRVQSSGPALRSVTVDSRLSTFDWRLFDRSATTKRLFGLDEVLHLPIQLEIVFGRLRRSRRRRRLVRRNLDTAVKLEPGARRNQAAHRDVFLQAAKVVDAARDRRL